MSHRKYSSLLLLFLVAILSSLVSAQTAQSKQQQNTPDACDQFKTIVVKPENTVDTKMPVRKPDESTDYKGIVINPCEQKFFRAITPSASKKAGKMPAAMNQLFTPNSAVRPVGQILNATEMLKKARAAEAQKEKK